MKLSYSTQSFSEVPADLAVAFIFKDASLLRSARTELTRMFGSSVIIPMNAGDFMGAEKESALAYPVRKSAAKRLLMVGLGERRKCSLESYRRAAANAAKQAKQLKSEKVSMLVPVGAQKPAEVLQALCEGAALALYSFDKYKKQPADEKESKVESITFCLPRAKRLTEAAKLVADAQIVTAATCIARDLANAPGNEIYPESLAQAVQDLGQRHGFSVTVLEEPEIKNLGMGGVLGVSQGSTRSPRFLILEHGKKNSGKTIVLVGKGVTFDSGGISIKPSAGMAEMKMDMSGAAAVIGTFVAIAELKFPVHVIGLIPAVENMPSGNSLRPGDVLRHHNGLTSEVDNTDAEGRLILADALSYAEKFKPLAIIDLATLTGACIVALGHHAAGMMGNDSALMEKLESAGERVFERVWQLPLFEEYEQQIKSDIADVKNVGGRWAGAITGALFLKRFVGKQKWVHLDIAGTAISEETGFYVPKGGTGFGVRLLTEFLKSAR
ncbi:MAG: leucyl aminopeptidase [Ignavibacteria bacterium]|nr:leucyl aminopeptidase [Ignavibacteria bacterium]